MGDSPVSLKGLIYTTIFACVIISFVAFQPLLFPKTFISMCDVGQGDAFYIHQSNGIDMLIDTGPNASVLECLGEAMVFTDKRIDYVFISHPHLDHYGGLPYILEQYSIGTVYIPPVVTKSITFTKLLESIHDTSHLEILTAGLEVQLGEGASIRTLWPTPEYIQRNTSRHALQEDVRFSSSNPNDFSLVQIYTYNNADVLFTGDVSVDIFLRLLTQYNIQTVDILKVPHHGSETGLVDEILSILMPEKALISAGKKNRYGHPSKKIIEMLQLHEVPIFLTSDVGSVTFEYQQGDWVLRQSCFLVFNC